MYENLQNYHLEIRSAEENDKSSIINIHLNVQASLRNVLPRDELLSRIRISLLNEYSI